MVDPRSPNYKQIEDTGIIEEKFLVIQVRNKWAWQYDSVDWQMLIYVMIFWNIHWHIETIANLQSIKNEKQRCLPLHCSVVGFKFQREHWCNGFGGGCSETGRCCNMSHLVWGKCRWKKWWWWTQQSGLSLVSTMSVRLDGGIVLGSPLGDLEGVVGSHKWVTKRFFIGA